MTHPIWTSEYISRQTIGFSYYQNLIPVTQKKEETPTEHNLVTVIDKVEKKEKGEECNCLSVFSTR